MNEERKTLVLASAIMISLVIFVGSLGYIGMVIGAFGSNIGFSPQDVYSNECINHNKVNCNFYNPILNDLLCEC